jgi:hypothetical protein
MHVLRRRNYQPIVVEVGRNLLVSAKLELLQYLRQFAHQMEK